MTAPSFNLRARSALKPSPVDKTCRGLAQVGIEFKPTAVKRSIASSTLSKCEATLLLLFQ